MGIKVIIKGSKQDSVVVGDRMNLSRIKDTVESVELFNEEGELLHIIPLANVRATIPTDERPEPLAENKEVAVRVFANNKTGFYEFRANSIMYNLPRTTVIAELKNENSDIVASIPIDQIQQISVVESMAKETPVEEIEEVVEEESLEDNATEETKMKFPKKKSE